MMPRRNHNAQPSDQRPSALERLMLADIEAGIDPRAPATITVGEYQPRRDRTIAAAPLGWTPDDDDQL